MEESLANDAEVCEVNDSISHVGVVCQISSTNSSKSTQETMDTDNRCEPSSLHICLKSATYTLKALYIAREKGLSYTMCDLSYDGNCNFSAIAFQLQSMGTCNGDANGMVVDHLDYGCQLQSHWLATSI